MSALQLFYHLPWVERLGWTLLHFLWQGALISVLYAVTRLIPGRAQTRYALACIALAVMMAAPLLTFGWIGGAGLQPAIHLAGASPGSQAVPGNAAAVTAWSLPAADLWRQSLPWIVMLWLAGAIAFSVRLMGGWIVATRLRSVAARPAPREWQQALDRLIPRVGVSRPVRLLISSLVQVPTLVGWLRPVVLVPAGALAGLPSAHLEALLAHELGHIWRHDYLANLLQSVAEALLFYHPAVWWVSGQIRAERELCCDDLAVAVTGDALTYAHALAELESCRPAHIRAALAANGGSLVSRIGRLLSREGAQTQPISHTPPGPAAALALGILLLAGIGAVAVRGGQEPVSAPANAAAERQRDERGITVELSGAGVMHRPSVEYPGSAIERGVQGTVAVEVTLDAAGQVSDARIMSGPIELRKAVLQSVLQWHFMPGAAGATRQVSIAFQLPNGSAVSRQPAIEVRQLQELATKQQEIVARQRQENSQLALTPAQQLDQGRAAPEEKQAKLQSQIQELERLLPAAQEQPRAQIQSQLEELRKQRHAQQANEPGNQAVITEPEGRIWVLRLEPNSRASFAGSTLTTIEIRGMADEAGNDLLSRLPVHEGDTLSGSSIESARRTIREYDQHLEATFDRRDGDVVVLRIHPAGSAGAPLIRRK